MKRRSGRWLVYALIAVILLAIAFILSINPIAKFIAERRIRDETGMDTKIGKFTVGLRSSTIHIENFILKNPTEFGGGTFLEMPEIFLNYDREALRAGKLHLKLVRIAIAKLHMVENKDGKKNIDELQKHQRKPKAPGNSSGGPSRGATNQSNQPFEFEGIDTLDVTLKSVQFTSFKNPNQNLEQDLGIQHETFRNLKTEKDFQTAAALISLKAGATLLMSGEFSNPITLLLGGSAAGKETKSILEGVVEPLSKKPQPDTNP